MLICDDKDEIIVNDLKEYKLLYKDIINCELYRYDVGLYLYDVVEDYNDIGIPYDKYYVLFIVKPVDRYFGLDLSVYHQKPDEFMLYDIIETYFYDSIIRFYDLTVLGVRDYEDRSPILSERDVLIKVYDYNLRAHITQGILLYGEHDEYYNDPIKNTIEMFNSNIYGKSFLENVICNSEDTSVGRIIRSSLKLYNKYIRQKNQ